MQEIRELNNEIHEMEIEYWNRKSIYGKKRAKILLETDWGMAIGKAKPTVAEKDAYIERELADYQFHYRVLRTNIDCKKRLFQVMLKELGDD